MFALDINTITHFFKGAGRVGERLLGTPPHQVAIPSLVVYELEVGILKSGDPAKRCQQFSALLAQVRVLPFTQVEAEGAAQIRTVLEAKGEGIGPLGTLTAGVAVASQTTLVTRNVWEFSRVEDLEVVNWYD